MSASALNVDSQGVFRGRCRESGCLCAGYHAPAKPAIRCDYCDHTPGQHDVVVPAAESEGPTSTSTAASAPPSYDEATDLAAKPRAAPQPRDPAVPASAPYIPSSAPSFPVSPYAPAPAPSAPALASAPASASVSASASASVSAPAPAPQWMAMADDVKQAPPPEGLLPLRCHLGVQLGGLFEQLAVVEVQPASPNSTSSSDGSSDSGSSGSSGGLLVGDRVVSIAGERVTTAAAAFNAVQQAFQTSGPNPIEFRVERLGEFMSSSTKQQLSIRVYPTPIAEYAQSRADGSYVGFHVTPDRWDGPVVSTVDPYGPGKDLLKGDVLNQWNGTAVNSANVLALLGSVQPGVNVIVQVRRVEQQVSDRTLALTPLRFSLPLLEQYTHQAVLALDREREVVAQWKDIAVQPRGAAYTPPPMVKSAVQVQPTLAEMERQRSDSSYTPPAPKWVPWIPPPHPAQQIMNDKSSPRLRALRERVSHRLHGQLVKLADFTDRSHAPKQQVFSEPLETQCGALGCVKAVPWCCPCALLYCVLCQPLQCCLVPTHRIAVDSSAHRITHEAWMCYYLKCCHTQEQLDTRTTYVEVRKQASSTKSPQFKMFLVPAEGPAVAAGENSNTWQECVMRSAEWMDVAAEMRQRSVFGAAVPAPIPL